MLYKHLKYFIELVEVENYTRAAQNLYVSQSTISKAINKLEKEIGRELIRTKNGRFILTKEAKILYDFAKDVTEYYEKKEEDMLSKIRKVYHKLTVGLPPTAGSIYFFEKIAEFKEKYPDVDLEIKNETSKYLPDILLDMKLDLAVVIEPFDDDRFIKKTVYNSEAVLAVSKSHPIAKLDEIDFSSLKDEKFLQVSKDYQYYWVFKDYCNKAGFEPNIVFENYDWDMILEMVAANQGVTILPKPLTEKYFSDRLKLIKLKNPKFPWSLTIIYPKNISMNKEMKNFISIC